MQRFLFIRSSTIRKFNDELVLYDWLHLHHEDFYRSVWEVLCKLPQCRDWHIQQQKDAEVLLKKHGFSKVSLCKIGRDKKIKEYVVGGGFMFAMCSATDTYAI